MLLALRNDAALLTRTRHRNHEFAVLLGYEVFGAAGANSQKKNRC